VYFVLVTAASDSVRQTSMMVKYAPALSTFILKRIGIVEGPKSLLDKSTTQTPLRLAGLSFAPAAPPTA